MADAKVDNDGQVTLNTQGEMTTEYSSLQGSSRWGNIAMIAGIIMAVGPQILASTPEKSTMAGIIGALITVSGIILKILAAQNYNFNRTAVKKAMIQGAVDASAIQAGITPAPPAVVENGGAPKTITQITNVNEPEKKDG